MKLSLHHSAQFISSGELALFLQTQWQKRPIPCQVFLLLCLNLIIAPAVQAASEGNLSRLNAYALGLLGLAAFGLAVYLFVVIFQPERF